MGTTVWLPWPKWNARHVVTVTLRHSMAADRFERLWSWVTAATQKVVLLVVVAHIIPNPRRCGEKAEREREGGRRGANREGGGVVGGRGRVAGAFTPEHSTTLCKLKSSSYWTWAPLSLPPQTKYFSLRLRMGRQCAAAFLTVLRVGGWVSGEWWWWWGAEKRRCDYTSLKAWM